MRTVFALVLGIFALASPASASHNAADIAKPECRYRVGKNNAEITANRTPAENVLNIAHFAAGLNVQASGMTDADTTAWEDFLSRNNFLVGSSYMVNDSTDTLNVCDANGNVPANRRVTKSDYKLRGQKVSCKSDQRLLNHPNDPSGPLSPAQCAQQCAYHAGCIGFVHGFKGGDYENQCWWEYTSGFTGFPRVCAEGWNTNRDYNFYEFNRQAYNAKHNIVVFGG